MPNFTQVPKPEEVNRRNAKAGESTSAEHGQVQRALENPSSQTLTPNVIQQLQSSHGNQFVSRLASNVPQKSPLSFPVQAKLTVTAANDQYEQEADSMAQNVVSQINNGGADVQREGEEDEMMMSRIQREEEDEMMMSRIQREEEDEMMMSRIQREEEDEMMMSRIQREGEEDEMMMSRIQRSELDYEQGGDVDSSIESQIEQSRGGGQPLDTDTQQQMEGAFGADFSGVRIHTDSNSDALNRSVMAKAFTTGNDIFFSGGAYDPQSSGGKELLAHELTHTIQQGASSVQPKREDE